LPQLDQLIRDELRVVIKAPDRTQPDELSSTGGRCDQNVKVTWRRRA